ncbi:MAG TPA: YbhB/YbcL family Raf kinase inhibitor-like protein [Candidatus Paceibacterota bacterium]|nr:YbhB/YbcL family Raf kinase inhibitor-like protein [Candidatus Paceibacterota bacterium]
MKRAYFIYAIIFILATVAVAFILPKKGLSLIKQSSMDITSSEFKNNGPIPSKFTCQGENINPELEIGGVPANAKSLALIMDDPDIPDYVKQARGIDVFDHWVVFNISPQTSLIEEGKEPDGTAGINDGGKTGYAGPCPPDKEHRYFFKLYALDSNLDLPVGSNKADVEKAMSGHIIAQAELIGTYVKK